MREANSLCHNVKVYFALESHYLGIIVQAQGLKTDPNSKTNLQPTEKQADQPPVTAVARLLLLALAYFVSGRLGLELPYLGSHITLIWIPTGIAVAALSRWGYACWPGIFLGSFAINFSIDMSPFLDGCIAMGNTLAPLLAVWILRRLNFVATFERAQDILLMIVAAAVGMLVSASGGVASLLLFQALPVQDAGLAWLSWWAGDTVGVLLAAPLLFNVSRPELAKLWSQRLEFSAWFMVTFALGWWVFFSAGEDQRFPHHFAYLMFPVMVWVAMRFSKVGSTLALLLPVLIAAVATGRGLGPFHIEDNRHGMFLLWLFYCSLILVNLMVVALQARRNQFEISLQQSEARFRQMFKGHSSVMMLIDPVSGEIVAANEAASRFYCYTIEQLMGMHISQINTMLPEEIAAARDQALHENRNYFVFPHRLASGEVRTVEVHSSPIEIAGHRLLFSIVHDITERKENEAKIQRLMNLYSALSQCNQAILRCKSEDELFPQVCKYAVQLGGMKMAWIGLVDEKTHTAKPVASYGSGTEYVDGIKISVNADEPTGRGPFGTAYRDDCPVWMQDFHKDQRLAPWHERGKRYGWEGVAALPLHRHGVVYGVLMLYAAMPDAFDDAARSLLEGMATDISYALTRFALLDERSKTEDAMRIAAVTFETQEAILITDPDAVILRVNHAFQEITGYRAEEVIGKNPRILQSGKHDAAFYQAMWSDLKSTGKWSGEVWDRRKDGEIYPKLMTITAVSDDDGHVTHYVAVFRDISNRKKSEAEIHQLAFYDALTLLPNRRLLTDRLQQALAASARNGRYGALLFLDMDHFKTINDTQGHVMGDQLLIEVAHRLLACVRDGDSVARLGGDEFVVVLEGLSNDANEAAAQTELVAEKIRVELEQPYVLNDFECLSSASIGISLFFGHLESVEDLLMHADVSMYQAKSAGRNTVRFFDPAMQTALDQRASLESDLRYALEKQQFLLYFQIQVDSRQRVLGAELLLRWQHPERGLLAPLQFVPLCEETGLIVPIGLWVLKAACSQLKAWQQESATRDLALAVNVSARQFRQADFVVQVQHILVESGAKPDLLKLELTESTVLENVQDTINKMRELKLLGVRFSMDDFGTGYSSLQYLKRLPLDQIKIDQSFVRDIATDPNDAAIVQTIIAMSEVLGLNVIAEGVENEAQHLFLDQHGCHAFQGYLFGKPMPIDQFEGSLRGRK